MRRLYALVEDLRAFKRDHVDDGSSMCTQDVRPTHPIHLLKLAAIEMRYH